ncbi:MULTISPECIES: hydroxymethylglutaryl-CoA lyase [unclassified Mesobacillus]|jgi:hydroxymethylglutaryl-CoA lyase|uniref:hydroxymethylglutaryl-CoA lyase n=1 Tax=unclassified Mesobacillus TaxID=2675270 RepID=UPI00203BEF84|nr:MULTISPECIES: hydroxymethylglutaryl-CoA lyase [unclassified Mesobacillus]MCM3122917.1 hydroxymethylglutaryl-CoA lyase [Mesobacillus sp. MER 33]MCM3233600.1 hydroxymethylglutaryl-CoA lyase [Mesobacillus sp. MER 48]
MLEICEVGPRDGLQNEKKILSTETKVTLIEKLIDSGITYIEAVSFVNPRVVPQMADAEEVMNQVPKSNGITYAGLVLSKSGLERAVKTDIDVIHIVTTTSDTFNLKNARRTVEEATQELTSVMKAGISAGKRAVGVLGTAFGCPYEGNVPFDRVLKTAEAFLEAGFEKITLADTTGMANPAQVQAAVSEFTKAFGTSIPLGLHFHNTRGLGLANILAGYNAGVRSFDSSIAGLGGCPFAPNAVGNVCTEDMVNMFHSMGIHTGTKLEELIEIAQWMEHNMERPLAGMLMKAGVCSA